MYLKALYYPALFLIITSCHSFDNQEWMNPAGVGKLEMDEIKDTVVNSLDTVLYNNLLLHLVGNKPSGKWPVKTTYPLPGAIFPFKRVVAYYGNFYSSRMGVLGELPPEQMLQQLCNEVKKWQVADTTLPVIPALHYIAVTAQSTPGTSKKYRLQMPASEIEKVLQLSQKIDALVFLDIQVGLGALQEEILVLEKYLRLPNVHLGIDPEYAMKNRQVPCTTIGTFDAADINYATSYLADLVQQYHLPPKILIVHRFTQAMVTNYRNILIRPEVQIVINMDGFGSQAKKIDTYKSWIAGQPVQFTGFKLFYKNDKANGEHLMEPAEVLQLYPSPVYIQYQ